MGRKRMTANATIQVETRPEAVGDLLELLEVSLPVEEQRSLVGSQSRNRVSDGISRGGGTEARIRGGCLRRRPRGPTQHRNNDRSRGPGDVRIHNSPSRRP